MPKLHILTKDDAGKDIILRKSHIHKVIKNPASGITTIHYTDRKKPCQRVSGTVNAFFKLLLLAMILLFPFSEGINPAVADDTEEDSVWEDNTSTTIINSSGKVIVCDTTDTGLVICYEL